MSDDLDSICKTPIKKFNIGWFLDSRNQVYTKLTYLERENKKVKIKEAKRKSKENFEKIKVSKDIADIWAKIYDYLDSSCDMLTHEKEEHIKRANRAFDINDIETLDMIYDEIRKTMSARNLNFYKNKILKSIGCNISEIEPMLNEIKNANEADIVLTSVEGSDWITKLPKQYPVDFIYSEYTYKDQVRLHRRMLEKDLKEVGVIDRRAQKISQIILSI